MSPPAYEEDYRGVRVTLTAMIANARLPIQIDIGFGDAVALQATEVTYPLLLDFPPAILKAYPPERIVAENWKRWTAFLTPVHGAGHFPAVG
jgi:hypothetical protein